MHVTSFDYYGLLIRVACADRVDAHTIGGNLCDACNCGLLYYLLFPLADSQRIHAGVVDHDWSHTLDWQ